MEIKIKNKRTFLLMIAFAILLYWGLEHMDALLRAGERFLGIIFPFLLGGAIAFVVNVPMKNIERLIAPAFRGKDVALRAAGILLSFLLVIGIVAFVVMMVIPELIYTLAQLNAGIPRFFENINKWMTGVAKDYPQIRDYLTSFELNWADITQKSLDFLRDTAGNVLSSTWGITASVIEGITSAVLGLIFSIYILAEKEKLGMQFRKIIYAYLPPGAVVYILRVGRLANRTFSGFISGQCTEAVVFGLLCYTAMVFFGFPYAACVSVLIGFMTLLPIVGAFLGAALGALLIMVSSPMQALWFVIMVVVLQQIDGNLIYPRIVGGSVGLPGLWVLAAVTVGGSLMGVGGMLIFVPLVSVIYALFRENVYKNLQEKEITREMLER